MTYINLKNLKSGNWKDLNIGEDIEFLSRQKISITFSLIIGKNEDATTSNLYKERKTPNFGK